MSNDLILLNFIDLSLDEKKLALSWRNYKKTRKWMFNTNEISLENHLNFINSLKKAEDKIYFLIKTSIKYIGVIDFTNINYTTKECEIGLYSNIELHGVGKSLLNSICEYSFNTLHMNNIYANVFKDNIKAISLYETFGFQKISNKLIDNKEVIYMELKNENR